MTDIVVTSAIAPLMAEPSPRAELGSQLLMGETGAVLEQRDAWLRITRQADGYSGWIHRGYLRICPTEEAAAWSARATLRSQGAELEVDGKRVPLPLLARVAPGEDGTYELANGQRARLAAGMIQPAETMRRSALAFRTVDWATAHFSGAAYLWGGVTPWGVDCSGLVQSVYAARAQLMPRDSSEQEKLGETIDLDAVRPGDLYFFSESGKKVTHVAFAGDDQTLVHSTLACGGFIVESFRPGSRAHKLKDQLVSVKRI